MEQSRSSYLAVKQDTKLLLDRVGAFLSDVTRGDEYSVPSAQALLDQQLTKAFEAYYSVKQKFEEDELRVAFLALTKSGKSTLLNAFIGSTILPSNNVPETARIVAIKHLPGATGAQASLAYSDRGDQVMITGEDSIRLQLKYLNQEARGRQHRVEDNSFLNVSLEVAALRNEAAEDQDISLTLLDTPGPNEAGEEALRHQVDRLLQDVGCCVWVLDYTKLKTEEERLLLAKLKDMNPQLVQRLSQRLFFVVNKTDLMQTNDGLEEDELREYVADLITSQFNNEAFQLLPEQVLLVSAQNALLSRLVLANKASAKERARFGALAFGRKASSMDEREYHSMAAEMLAESGLPDLEEQVLQYLFNNAGALKLLSLLDDITCQLHQVQNVALIGKGSLQQGAKQLEEEAAELHAQLGHTLAQFNIIQNEALQVEAEVVDNVQNRLQTLKERLFEHVEEVLDFSKEPTLSAVKSGRWRSAFDKAVHFFTGRGAESSSSRDDMQGKLQDLHDSIYAQFEAEVRDFWGALEASTNAKQVQLLGSINAHLEHLARQIEHKVGSVLDVRLEPVLIRMDPPTAQEFHSSLQDLFSQGIGEKTQSHTRVKEESYVVWERRYRGLCRTSEYYVGRPATKTVQEEYMQTTYELQPDRIKEYFIGMIESTIGKSIWWVRSYVHAYLSEHVANARHRIEDYGSRYTDTMQAALLTKSQGAEAQERGVQSMERHLAHISELLAEAGSVSQRAAQVFPQAADAAFHWVPAVDDSEQDEEDLGNNSKAVLHSTPLPSDELPSLSSVHYSSDEFESIKSAGTAASQEIAAHDRDAAVPATVHSDATRSVVVDHDAPVCEAPLAEQLKSPTLPPQQQQIQPEEEDAFSAAAPTPQLKDGSSAIPTGQGVAQPASKQTALATCSYPLPKMFGSPLEARKESAIQLQEAILQEAVKNAQQGRSLEDMFREGEEAKKEAIIELTEAVKTRQQARGLTDAEVEQEVEAVTEAITQLHDAIARQEDAAQVHIAATHLHETLKMVQPGCDLEDAPREQVEKAPKDAAKPEDFAQLPIAVAQLHLETPEVVQQGHDLEAESAKLSTMQALEPEMANAPLQSGLQVDLPMVETAAAPELPVSDGQQGQSTVYSVSSNAGSPKSAQSASGSAVLIADTKEEIPDEMHDSAIMRAASDEDSDGWELMADEEHFAEAQRQ